MSERTILQIMPAPDMHVLYFDEHDPDAWGVCPLCGWALVEGRLPQTSRTIGLVALSEVDFADCISDDIEYVSTVDLSEARERAVKRVEREKGRAA